jgi:hypothetical protein
MVASFFYFYVVFRKGFVTTNKTLRYVSMTDANETIKNGKQNKTKENIIKYDKIIFTVFADAFQVRW